ncbi:MAG: hypothetical protein RLY93_10475 [Sumerlaeia bacterium]
MTPFSPARLAKPLTKLAFLAAAAMVLAGCIGIYDNRKVFQPGPNRGMEERELLRQYGTPAYSGFVEDEKVYIYKVRQQGYYVLVGIYDGYDLVVFCDDGRVTDVQQAPLGTNFSFLNPVPWAVAE